MRKFIAVICLILLSVSCIYATALAASVPAVTLPGNDSNPMDYTPPEGCIHYEIPNSDTVGSHTVTFNDTGAVDPAGPFSFTVVVGKGEGEDFTKVLSWSSNFPIYAVIVKGGNFFNLYHYGTSVRSDTNLVAPTTPSGKPADISHVSIVICPEDFPPTPPTPTPTPIPTITPTPTPSPTPTITPTPTPSPTPVPCPCPGGPNPPFILCILGFFIVFSILIFIFFILGSLLCRCSFFSKHNCNENTSDNVNLNINSNIQKINNKKYKKHAPCNEYDDEEHPICDEYNDYTDHNPCDDYNSDDHYNQNKQNKHNNYPPMYPPDETF